MAGLVGVMAIHFVTGRPGAGKGLYTIRLIEAELRGTNRTIITNFPLLTDKLAEVMHERHGDAFDILTRVHLIESDDELRNFYRIRGQHHEEADSWLGVEKDKKGKPVSYDISGAFETGGVFYVLDEVHLVFGARDWQEMGRAVMYYSSQHRKLGDDVILITQAPKNVDNQFRSLAQDYTVLRNHGMEKIGWFKQPSIFGRRTYMNLPNPGGNEQPMETSHFKLDKELADCYETERGVGIEKGVASGAGADKGADRREGWPWWIFPLALVIFMSVAWYVIAVLPGKVIGKVAEMPQDAIKKQNAVEDRNASIKRLKGVLRDQQDQERRRQPTVAQTGLPEPTEEFTPVEVFPEVIGYAQTRYRGETRLMFSISDGRVLTTGTGQITKLSSDHLLDRHGNKVLMGPGIRFEPEQLLKQY